MQNLMLLLLFFSPAVLAAQQTAAPQNPCEELPVSQRQMNNCAAFEYKLTDSLLDKVYAKALQYMADDLAHAQKAGDQGQMKYEQTAITSLKEAERAWLSY